MFRALTCPSSGGQSVLSQHLVSPLSVNGCTVCRMRADSLLSSGILYSRYIMLHYNPQHVSSINMPVFRRTKCIITVSVIVTLCKRPAESALIRPTVQPFYESDDTRCCYNTICPTEDGNVDA